MGYLIILLVIVGLLCWKFWPREEKAPVQVDAKPEGQEQPFVIDPPIDDPDPADVAPPVEPPRPDPADQNVEVVASEQVVVTLPVATDDPIDVEISAEPELDQQIVVPSDPIEPEVPQQDLPEDPVIEPEAPADVPVSHEPILEIEVAVDAPVLIDEIDAPVLAPVVDEPIAIQPTDDPEPLSILQPADPVIEEPKPFEPALIFLIDDSVVVRTKLTRNVAAAGYRTLGAGDGVQGLKLLEIDTPDLIITDIEMPEMDGFQLIDHLNQNEATRYIPVIAISGHENIKDQLTQFPNVVDAFKKPWDVPALLARLEELVGPGKQSEA